MTALEYLAAETWQLMFVSNMPPGVALDRVQDECGGREAAYQALLGAVVIEMTRCEPLKREQRWRRAAMGIRGQLVFWNFAAAEEARAEVQLALVRARGTDAREDWLDWCHETKRRIRLCRELAELAGAAPPPDPMDRFKRIRTARR